MSLDEEAMQDSNLTIVAGSSRFVVPRVVCRWYPGSLIARLVANAGEGATEVFLDSVDEFAMCYVAAWLRGGVGYQLPVAVNVLQGMKKLAHYLDLELLTHQVEGNVETYARSSAVRTLHSQSLGKKTLKIAPCTKCEKKCTIASCPFFKYCSVKERNQKIIQTEEALEAKASANKAELQQQIVQLQYTIKKLRERIARRSERAVRCTDALRSLQVAFEQQDHLVQRLSAHIDEQENHNAHQARDGDDRSCAFYSEPVCARAPRQPDMIKLLGSSQPASSAKTPRSSPIRVALDLSQSSSPASTARSRSSDASPFSPLSTTFSSSSSPPSLSSPSSLSSLSSPSRKRAAPVSNSGSSRGGMKSRSTTPPSPLSKSASGKKSPRGNPVSGKKSPRVSRPLARPTRVQKRESKRAVLSLAQEGMRPALSKLGGSFKQSQNLLDTQAFFDDINAHTLDHYALFEEESN
jgi:Zn-finger protein